MNKNIWWALLIPGFLTGCGFFAVHFAPEKLPSKTRTHAAEQADDLFWKTLHSGQYDQIPTVLNALTAAYLKDSGDAITAAHVAWMHSWRFSERTRMTETPATITDHAVLSRKYFEEAVRLNPDDARYLGFLGGLTVAEGSIHKDEKLVRKGYYILFGSIRAWPEFNYFSAGYVMSQLPSDSEKFREGLEWQWKNFEVCAGEKPDRTNPDYARYMGLYTTEGKKRVCWNSWIAPHNFEGFFLNMGDMLVKSGDWKTARKIYANAKLSADYERWKFRDILEERMAQAEANVARFNAQPDATGRMTKPIMLLSAFACTGCHQE